MEQPAKDEPEAWFAPTKHRAENVTIHDADTRLIQPRPKKDRAKANMGHVLPFPVMIPATLALIMSQVRSFSTVFMAFAIGSLGLVRTVPTLIRFDQAFGYCAILGLIGFSGNLIRTTHILGDKIRHHKVAGLSDHETIIESAARRARRVSRMPRGGRAAGGGAVDARTRSTHCEGPPNIHG